MRSMTEGLLQSRKTTPQAAIAVSSPCTGEPKKGTNFGSFLFSVFTFSYLPSRMEATAMRVKMTHASARVISFAAL